MPHVLIVVQNLPVPFDRRVWLECQALASAGYRVSVVCPAAPGDPAEEVRDGITLLKYRPPATGRGPIAYAWEYAWSFTATARLVLRAGRRHRIDVLQACNPPDIFWPLALALHRRGTSFVFDHHDLCPELYEAKFPGRRSALHRVLRSLERATFRSADHVISTNRSYRSIAMARGGKRPDEVTVVRTGPDPERMRPGPPCPDLRRGRRYLCVYLGVMGPQDGVDLAVRAADHVVHRRQRSDISFTFVGSGEAYDEVVRLRDDLGLDGFVDLPGRLPDREVAQLLSTADVGLCPDPKNALNDVSTMNKTMEYMAYGLPVVAFDLAETRVSAAGAAAYAEPNLVRRFADLVVELVDDEPRRRDMAAIGRRRVVDVLAWSRQAPAYVGVFDRLTGGGRSAVPAERVGAGRA
ncbi:MAG: glycosyltransferase family 4 protein [Acidimicrobiales bacterium]